MPKFQKKANLMPVSSSRNSTKEKQHLSGIKSMALVKNQSLTLEKYY
jgi:hypothetical protein